MLKSLHVGGRIAQQLRKLHVLDLGHGHAVTPIGWDALNMLLCNTAGIDSTYDSNHTLCDIRAYDDSGDCVP